MTILDSLPVNARVGVVALIVVAGSVTSAHLAGGTTSTSVTPTDSLEQAVEQADNAWLAVYSPMANINTSGSICGSSCGGSIINIASEMSSESLLTAIGQFTSDYSAPAGTSVFETNAGSAMSGATLNTGSISMPPSTPYADDVAPSILEARNMIVTDATFSPSLASQVMSGADNINSEELGLWLNGTSSCYAEDCTVTGAAGTVVTSFVSETITGSTAVVVADETAWQDDGSSTTSNGPLVWDRIQNDIVATDNLQMSSNGDWLESSHSISLNGGVGP